MGFNIKMLISTSCCMAFVMSMSFYVAYAPDPPPLQDFCIAINDTNLAVNVNGEFCKNPRDVTSQDFVFRGFNTPGNTSNRFGSEAVMTNVFRFPALNTLGLTMGHIDYAPGGVNPLHFHPRSSEMLVVIQGTLFVGFIAANSAEEENTFYSAVLYEGDIFVFPQGMIHFQLNIGCKPAVANAGFASQNPGRVDIHRAVFGSMPGVPNVVLRIGFQVNQSVVEALRAQFIEEGVLEFDSNCDGHNLLSSVA